jgi:hypothetical protein
VNGRDFNAALRRGMAHAKRCVMTRGYLCWRSAGAHKNAFFIGDGINRAAHASIMETDAQNAKAHGDTIGHVPHEPV